MIDSSHLTEVVQCKVARILLYSTVHHCIIQSGTRFYGVYF